MKTHQLLGDPAQPLRRILGTKTLKPYPLMLYKYRREITAWEEKTLLEHEI